MPLLWGGGRVIPLCMWLLVIWLGCAAELPPPPPPPVDPATSTVPTLLGDAPGVRFLGNWTSPSCGGRGYARNLRFEAEQAYAGIDLVSPCPKGTTCVWSGMTGFAGIWKQEGTKLLLREMGGGTATGGPHPTEVESTADGKLVENGCLYTAGLTVPPGYTEEEVTPRVPGTAPGAVVPPAAVPPAPGAPVPSSP